MAFQRTEWEFSDVVDATQIPAEEGVQYLLILDAIYNDESDEYTLSVKSLTNDAEFNLRYWLTTRDQNGALLPNSKSRGTLISLGVALAGEPIGIPNPVDIRGGVVQANVTMGKPNAKGVQYPRVYTFQAVPEDIVLGFATIDQYFIPSEE
jgi:hypothetical protein